MLSRRNFLGSTIAVSASTGLVFKAIAATPIEPIKDELVQIDRWLRLFRATPEQQMATRFLFEVREIGLLKGPKVKKVERPSNACLYFEAEPLDATIELRLERLVVIDWLGEHIGTRPLRRYLGGPKEHEARWRELHPDGLNPPKFQGDTLYLNYTLNLSIPPIT